MNLVLLLLLVLTGLGVWESRRQARCRRAIPVRVHVNGSRGKSSVTRLIVAGLRGGGLRVAGKTTGSAARYLHPDGRESPVVRHGPPNIREQLRIFRTAAAEGAEAIVIECMAVRPDLQRVCEDGIVQATIGVITNARPDHLEVMGPTLADVADSLAATVPRHGHLVTAETRFADLLRARADARGSAFTLARAADVAEAELAAFPHVEFAENVSLALAACAAAGVPREAALAGMRAVAPDVGALVTRRYRDAAGELTLANAFAANDAVSTTAIWRRLGLHERPHDAVLLFNARADRQRRTRDLAPLFGRELTAACYVLIGDGTRLLADLLRRQGLAPERIVDLGGRSPEQVWRGLLPLATPAGAPPRLVVGVGNIHGGADALLAWLATREVTA